ncbi:hypothetical protein ONZ51_g7107 [Trametes cubensis]|uniref:Uncharacterized protein n=1 Tax=Trametes cubensis TaxID=1111947 RepID=A0AAD7TR64_9APHY|nr:hypothetical protein ONZ51_g7107 [Trametes cubensis]
MSVSPPIRRFSSTSSSSREDLIYQYEAEEERIINILSRKLEQLREEKIELENVLEQESESHVNRLSREISALRLAQQQQQQQQQAGPSHTNGSGYASPQDTRLPAPQNGYLLNTNGSAPAPDTILDALRRENEALRNRLVETEQDFIRISRLNEVYREELIQHRRRLGLPVDNLIGLHQSDPYSQPTHRRSYSSTSGSPSSSIHIPVASASRQASAVPIPRPPSQIHRPANVISSESTTPLSHSPSSASTSPFPFSPATTSPFPASYASAATHMTTPPSAAFLPRPYLRPSALPPHRCTNPSESRMSTTGRHRPSSHSTAAGTASTDAGVLSGGSPRPGVCGASARAAVRASSVGGRIAETGVLVPRARSGSVSLPEAVEDADYDPVASGPDDRPANGVREKSTPQPHS